MKLREIERLRGFAVLLTVVGHLSLEQHRLLSETGGGVHLFFVISGFVISLSFLKTLPDFAPGEGLRQRLGRSREAVQSFFIRRWFRIVPLSLTWVLIPLAASLAYHDQGLAFFSILREIAAIFTFSYNYWIGAGGSHLLVHYWSLSVEEQFYVIFPFLMIWAASFQKRLWVSLVGCAVVALILRPWIAFHGEPQFYELWMKHSSHRTFDFLFVGVALGLLDRRGWLEWSDKPPRALMIALSVICLATLSFMPDRAPFDFAFGPGMAIDWLCAAVLVMLASRDRGLIFGIPGLRGLLEYVGSRSYGIYLSNRTAILLVGHVRELLRHEASWDPPFLSYVICCYALTVLMSEMTYRVIEKPLIERGHRLLAKR